MEPDTQAQESGKSFINKRTHFIKLLAIFLFITLPFVTLYLGYHKGTSTLPISSNDAYSSASTTLEKNTYIDSFDRSRPDTPGALDFTVLATSLNGEKQYLLDSHYEGWFESRIVYKDTNPFPSYTAGDFGLYRTDPSIFVMPDTREKRAEWTSPSGKYLALEAAAQENEINLCVAPGEPRKTIQVIELDTAKVFASSMLNDKNVSYSIEKWIDDVSIYVIAHYYQVRKANDSSGKECLDKVVSEERKTLVVSDGRLRESVPNAGVGATTRWLVYANSTYNYKINYPEAIPSKEGDWVVRENGIGASFGPSYTMNGGGLWTVSVYDEATQDEHGISIQTLVKGLGSQFEDREEVVENVVINGIEAILVTVSSDSHPAFGLQQEVYLERNGVIYRIGGEKSPEFKTFYSSFSLI